MPMRESKLELLSLRFQSIFSFSFITLSLSHLPPQYLKGEQKGMKKPTNDELKKYASSFTLEETDKKQKNEEAKNPFVHKDVDYAHGRLVKGLGSSRDCARQVIFSPSFFPSFSSPFLPLAQKLIFFFLRVSPQFWLSFCLFSLNIPPNKH